MRDPMEVPSRDERPTRSPGLTFVGLLAGAVLLTGLIGQLTSPTPPPRPPVAVDTTTPPVLPTPQPAVPLGVDSIRECPVELGGLILGDHRRMPGSALERWDCDAPKGPWSVTISASGGHFGVQGAVVTFPVHPVGPGLPSTKPQGAIWEGHSHLLVWPLGGSFAQIVGDLGRATLENLASHIKVAGGKPVLAGVDGYAASAATPYDSPLVHEMRYSTDDLGEAGLRGSGLIYTGVTLAGSFESLAFAAGAKPAGFVRGEPAIFSTVPSGNGALAWRSAPGEVTYIGTDGIATRANSIETLRALAENGRVLTPVQWETKDRFRTTAPRH
jgi:hypothetical protein